MKPWLGVFNEAFVSAMVELDKPSMDVFLAILETSDAYGRGYPGMRRLITRSHHAHKRVVHCLRKLHEVGLIRSRWLTSEKRGIYLDFYMVNPDIFAAHPQLRDRARLIWSALPSEVPLFALSVYESRSKESASVFDSRSNESLGVFDSRSTESQQPEQPLVTTTSNYLHEPPPTESANDAGAELEERKEKEHRGKAKRSSKAAAQAANTPAAEPHQAPPHTPPYPPSPLRLKPLDVPLEGPLETLAEKVYKASMYELSLANARALVATYGTDKCVAAIGHLANQQQPIRSKGGYLRWLIENGQVDAAKDGAALAAQTTGQGIAGDLHSFIIE